MSIKFFVGDNVKLQSLPIVVNILFSSSASCLLVSSNCCFSLSTSDLLFSSLSSMVFAVWRISLRREDVTCLCASTVLSRDSIVALVISHADFDSCFPFHLRFSSALPTAQLFFYYPFWSSYLGQTDGFFCFQSRRPLHYARCDAWYGVKYAEGGMGWECRLRSIVGILMIQGNPSANTLK